MSRPPKEGRPILVRRDPAIVRRDALIYTALRDIKKERYSLRRLSDETRLSEGTCKEGLTSLKEKKYISLSEDFSEVELLPPPRR